jgi:hypothetical protein
MTWYGGSSHDVAGQVRCRTGQGKHQAASLKHQGHSPLSDIHCRSFIPGSYVSLFTTRPRAQAAHKELHKATTLVFVTMSFDRLSSLESQPTTTRRQDDPQYRDDPEFHKLTESLSTRLFELTSNIARLSNQIALLGTKRDTERVRERVHDMLEETRDGFKDVGEGIKRAQTWTDLNVGSWMSSILRLLICLAISKIHQPETITRIRLSALRVPGRTTESHGEREGIQNRP